MNIFELLGIDNPEAFVPVFLIVLAIDKVVTAMQEAEEKTAGKSQA